MTINTSAQAIHKSLQQSTNVPGTCQMNVRTWFNAPSAGDQDGDGDADAVDGWESEPKKYRHPGDRNPPDGVPLSFHGGSRGFGHRAMSGADDHAVRSTDMEGNSYHAGVTGTVKGGSRAAAISIIEGEMGVVYTGWSETIDGQLIPNFKYQDRKPPMPQTRGKRIDRSLRRLRKAQALAIKNKKPLRARLIGAAIKSLLAIPTHDKKRH